MRGKKGIGKAIVAVIVIGAIGAGVFWWRKTSAASTPAVEAPTYEKVKRGPIRQIVQCTGRTVAFRDIEIKCRASGEVITLPYDVSDPVKKGDLLLELDEKDQERMVQQSEAALAGSQARLAQAESNLLSAQANLVASKAKAEAALHSAEARATDAKAKAKREEELLAKKYSSPEEFETARTSAVQAEQDLMTAQAQMQDIKAQELDLEARRQDIKMNEAQVRSNELALKLAQRQFEYTKVYAPIDGVVAARNIQIGQIISSGVTNVGGGTTAFILCDLSHVYIYASVDESDIGNVKLGQPAEVTADAFPRMPFRGEVVRIATKGVNLQNVVTFEVRIEVTSRNKDMLKPEMTANVDIIIAEKEDTILVPATGISRERRDTFVALQTANGKIEEKHPVKIGISDGVQTEVLEGVKEGDVIQVQPPEAESRWRTGGPGGDDRMRRGMMMRTMGGGAGGPGGRGGGGGGGGGGRGR